VTRDCVTLLAPLADDAPNELCGAAVATFVVGQGNGPPPRIVVVTRGLRVTDNATLD